MSIDPIRPSETTEAWRKLIPDSVIEVWNELIAKGAAGGKHNFSISQDDAVLALLEKHPDMTRRQIFDRKWLDIEEIYRSYGWEIEYHKSPYYDSSPSYFEFERGDQ